MIFFLWLLTAGKAAYAEHKAHSVFFISALAFVVTIEMMARFSHRTDTER